MADVGLFLDALRARFEDPSQVQRAEVEVLGLKQRGRPVREYVREFQRAAGQLRSWPECLLVHHFQAGLDKDLRQVCVVRGTPGRLHEWFRVVTELDAGLQKFGGPRRNRLPLGGQWSTQEMTVAKLRYLGLLLDLCSGVSGATDQGTGRQSVRSLCCRVAQYLLENQGPRPRRLRKDHGRLAKWRGVLPNDP